MHCKFKQLKFNCVSPAEYQRIGKFPPDTVLQLPRSAETVFLHRRISRHLPVTPCKNTVFALLRKRFDLLNINKADVTQRDADFQENLYEKGFGRQERAGRKPNSCVMYFFIPASGRNSDGDKHHLFATVIIIIQSGFQNFFFPENIDDPVFVSLGVNLVNIFQNQFFPAIHIYIDINITHFFLLRII
jgi:hypothetical protein